jgi:hypothetical protein
MLCGRRFKQIQGITQSVLTDRLKKKTEMPIMNSEGASEQRKASFSTVFGQN